MDPTSVALVYLTKAFAENKEAKEFKDDFFGAFVTWVRPLFLKDDPAAEAVLTMEGAEEAKKKILAAKLPKLLEDKTIRDEMMEWVSNLQTQEAREKDVIRNADVDVEGKIRIGDRNATPGIKKGLIRKNVVEGGKFKGGSFRLGDDYKH